MRFDATSYWGASSSLQVSLGGENLSYTAVSSSINSSGLSYNVYAANVSAFAGKIETLTFAVAPGFMGLDDIQFSPEIIPEPSAASLLFFGSGIFMCLRARKKLRLNEPD